MWHGAAGVFHSTSQQPANLNHLRSCVHQTVEIPDSNVYEPTGLFDQAVAAITKMPLNQHVTLLAQGLLHGKCAIFIPLEENMNNLHSLSPQIQYQIAVAVLVVGLAFGLAAKFLS